MLVAAWRSQVSSIAAASRSQRLSYRTRPWNSGFRCIACRWAAVILSLINSHLPVLASSSSRQVYKGSMALEENTRCDRCLALRGCHNLLGYIAGYSKHEVRPCLHIDRKLPKLCRILALSTSCHMWLHLKSYPFLLPSFRRHLPLRLSKKNHCQKAENSIF